MTVSRGPAVAAERYHGLVATGLLDEGRLDEAARGAAARKVDMERVLLRDYRVPKKSTLAALAEHYSLKAVEYDERLPIPPELVEPLDAEELSKSLWFPLAKCGDTITIAANAPDDPTVAEQFERYFPGYACETMVALREDILWFIGDYLHDKPGLLIGTERTGLAFWRNTMAHWRTRLACYRTTMAKARTDLASLRVGLGLTAISDAIIRSGKFKNVNLFWALMAAGLALAVYGLVQYLKLRHRSLRPPAHQTIVEVSSATMQFIENYHFIENTGLKTETKKTMLGRLGDFLLGHSTILYPSPASRERTHLARERNVLAAQRTVAGAYRTIYALARTGLAFIRTGISFISIGVGLLSYYEAGPMTVIDSMLILAGLFMAADGALWYLPVRKEQAEPPRCMPS